MSKHILIKGAQGSGAVPVIKEQFNNRPLLIIVPSYIRGKSLAADISFFMADSDIHLLEEEEPLFMGYQVRSNEKQYAFIAALHVLKGEHKHAPVIIAPISAAMKKLPPAQDFYSAICHLEKGESCDPYAVIERLVDLNYERSANVEAPGQFSLRGDILDVFAPGYEYPVRIEFFGDEIETIRHYDPLTQRSIKEISEVDFCTLSLLTKKNDELTSIGEKLLNEYSEHIASLESEIENTKTGKPADDRDESVIERLNHRREMLREAIFDGINSQILDEYIAHFYETPRFIWDYMGADSGIIIYDSERLKEMLLARDKENAVNFTSLAERGYVLPADSVAYSNSNDFKALFSSKGSAAYPDILTFQIFDRSAGFGTPDEIVEIKSLQTPEFHGDFEFLQKELDRLLKLEYEIHMVCSSDEKRDGLRGILRDMGFDSKVKLHMGTLSEGFELPDKKLIYLWEEDIFTKKSRRKKRKKNSDAQVLKNISDISSGDYVIHEDHGIGVYSGIEELTVEGITGEYIKIQYAGADLLYVPVDQMDVVQKYIGSATNVKINKLSGSEWKNTKEKTKAAIAEMAHELLEMSAKRESSGGYAFPSDTIWQREFEESFPYEETEDQLRAVEEIKADMEKPKPMDRLLCGDVGYGKTEVAARAIFKCLADGKQAGFLVPTTILANQHYSTLKERFENFPFKVEVLSRFRTAKQQADIVKRLAAGSIDLVIGTHRILSGDVKFKDLGLLVVDEEQRFGVGDKEKIKKFKSDVDVLTLSATPIPRTLHMSLVGIRDMSIIEEPPEDRLPVQTYVFEEDDLIIRNAIERELSRGGQVYLVYNRVKGIKQMEARIAALLPEAEIALGHGQMNEIELEQVMLDFIEGRKDVLIATTIIESGIDIPNANTIIIMNADRFGLSQLYQLRGRVGRSSKPAYAYLFYKHDGILTDVSERRLRAIRDFTEFGAGFKVAMKDLEIRGAGNVLGAEQSGHMINVGYELYCKMVDNAVRALSGEIVRDERKEVPVDIAENAYIPGKYIGDEAAKLEMYRKIAEIENEDDARCLIEEFEDRFGEMPNEVKRLIHISLIRRKAARLNIAAIKREGAYIMLKYNRSEHLKPEAASALAGEYRRRLMLHGGVKPFLKFRFDHEAGAARDLLDFLRFMEKSLGM